LFADGMGFPGLERPRWHKGFGHPGHCQANIQNAAFAGGLELDRPLRTVPMMKRGVFSSKALICPRPRNADRHSRGSRVRPPIISTPGQPKSRPSSGSVTTLKLFNVPIWEPNHAVFMI